MDRLDAADPRRIGPYTLLGRLGAGGMGAVYLGRSSGGRTVAVKVVRPELAGDVAFRDRFRAEVSAARAVSGAFTAPVVDADPEAAMPWMATAFVAGVPLSQAIATRGPLPEKSLWMLAAGVAEALGDIHRAKLIHRDLKPSNVLLAPDGPHVIDFGITRAMDGAAPLTATGAVIGSPGYMSPEQVLGHPVGPGSDMFSLGATLVYAAAGRGAYGEGATPALMFRIANSEPDPTALATVPASLRDAVTACLSRDPARRPTPRQLADYVDQTMGVTAGGSWLPPALTADVVAAGAVVTGAVATGDSSGSGGAGSGTDGATWTLPASQYAPTTPSGMAGGSGGTGGSDHPTGGPTGAPDGGPGGSGGGPNRRNLLIAAGGAAVVVGGGVAAVASMSGGGGTPRTDPTAPKTLTDSTSPAPNPSTASTTPTGPVSTTSLPQPAGSLGTMAGPDAKPAWTGTLAEGSSDLQLAGPVLISLGDNGVTGYDTATGKSRWPTPVPVKDGAKNTCTAGATVYAAGDLMSDSGGTEGLFAIDAHAGTVTWSAPIATTDSLPSSVSGVLNGIVFVEGENAATRTAWLSAVDAKTHKELWRLDHGADGAIHVPATGTKIYVGTVTDEATRTGQIQEYDAATGTKGWTLGVKDVLFGDDSSASIAMGSGSLIYIADQAYGVDPATSKQNWAYEQPGSDTFGGWPGISADGGLVVFVGTFTVYAVDAKTGRQKWKTGVADQSTSLEHMEAGAPQVADGNVYVLDSQNTLWALDAGTGATRWKHAFPVAPQWIAGGGYVYAAYGSASVAIKAAGQ